MCAEYSTGFCPVNKREQNQIVDSSSVREQSICLNSEEGMGHVEEIVDVHIVKMYIIMNMHSLHPGIS